MAPHTGMKRLRALLHCMLRGTASCRRPVHVAWGRSTPSLLLIAAPGTVRVVGRRRVLLRGAHWTASGRRWALLLLLLLLRGSHRRVRGSRWRPPLRRSLGGSHRALGRGRSHRASLLLWRPPLRRRTGHWRRWMGRGRGGTSALTLQNGYYAGLLRS